jgi:hypothetical protein
MRTLAKEVVFRGTMLVGLFVMIVLGAPMKVTEGPTVNGQRSVIVALTAPPIEEEVTPTSPPKLTLVWDRDRADEYEN